MERYRDRRHAGAQLATALKAYQNRSDVIVLGLPRGGVPVAYEVALALHAPLDVFIVRKLGVLRQPELAFGAIANGGVTVFNDAIVRELGITTADILAVKKLEEAELKRRERLYRGEKPFPAIIKKTIILVDDGIATGATMRAAIQSLRQYKPANIIVAVPVAAATTCEELSHLADKIICPLQPVFFNAVGAWYDIFEQTTDAEVHELLKEIPS